MKINSFDDLVGNSLSISLIKKGLARKSLPSLIFLKGVHGIGKSSIAELIGKAKTCLTPVNGLACNTCEMCIRNNAALNQSGVSTNLVKVNMAIVSKEGTVMEQIRDIFQLAKPNGHYVKVLEEFHALKESEQKLFLEETERLASNVTLILTSTSERSVIKEIKSRCLPFDFIPLTKGESSILIDRVNKKLKLKASDYEAIHRRSGGVPRDIVLLVDFLSKTDPTREEIDNALGVIGVDQFLNIMAVVNDFRSYHEATQELMKKADLSTVYWQFRDFLNQLTFAIEGGIYDSVTMKDLSILPELDVALLYKMQRFAEETNANQTEMELMFLRIRRLFAPAQTVMDQKNIAKQSAVTVDPSNYESSVQPLTRFGGGKK